LGVSGAARGHHQQRDVVGVRPMMRRAGTTAEALDAADLTAIAGRDERTHRRRGAVGQHGRGRVTRQAPRPASSAGDGWS
jgi:hypothetical protein